MCIVSIVHVCAYCGGGGGGGGGGERGIALKALVRLHMAVLCQLCAVQQAFNKFTQWRYVWFSINSRLVWQSEDSHTPMQSI